MNYPTKLAVATAAAIASVSWAVAANLPAQPDEKFLRERDAFVELLDEQITDWTRTRACVAQAQDRETYRRCGQ